jgi:hypothetical protein
MTVNERARATMSSAALQYVRTFYEDDDDRDGSELGAVEYAITRDQWESVQADTDGVTPSV